MFSELLPSFEEGSVAITRRIRGIRDSKYEENWPEIHVE